MGFGNSNNWQTEAALRNERLAKQTSLDKLLEHVNWDAETLTLSLNGITLSWGDIAGAGDVAMKSDIPTDAHITQITENSISTATIYMSQLYGGRLGGSGWKMTYSNNQFYVGEYIDGQYGYGSFSLNGNAATIDGHTVDIVAGGSLSIYAGTTAQLNDYEILTAGNYSMYLSYYSSGSTANFYKVYISAPGAISEDHSVLRYYESNGQICTTSSSRRWKRDIEDVKDEALDPHKLYEVPVRQFRYNEGTLVDGKDDVLRIGFIAEELEEIYPLATCHDKDGLASDWNDRALIPAMLKLIQELNERVKVLENG